MFHQRRSKHFYLFRIKEVGTKVQKSPCCICAAIQLRKNKMGDQEDEIMYAQQSNRCKKRVGFSCETPEVFEGPLGLLGILTQLRETLQCA